MAGGAPLLLTLLALFVGASTASHIRAKRDFMYVSSGNETDPGCFEACNTRWRDSFEYSFNLSLADFYEFPLHPILLDHSAFLLYCTLAEQKTRCYVDQCGDLSADTVFSPSNFICDFKRQMFSEVRPCLSESEPITFLKCDQACHEKTVERAELESPSTPAADEGPEHTNSVYSADQFADYERELATLCAFQACYMKCMGPIVKEVCAPSLASRAIELLSAFVKWHAVDIYEWHVTSERLEQLSPVCLALAEREALKDDVDQVMQLISRA